MSAWPQISVAAWLVLSVCGSPGTALRPPRGRLTIAPKQQRQAALMFCAAALGEASLLVIGGFFDRP